MDCLCLWPRGLMLITLTALMGNQGSVSLRVKGRNSPFVHRNKAKVNRRHPAGRTPGTNMGLVLTLAFGKPEFKVIPNSGHGPYQICDSRQCTV